jgi:hypothetical protein
MAKFYSSLKTIFTLDLRALALMRIALGALILLDLSIRASDLRIFYSDEGVLPLKTLFQHSWNPFNFSIHAASGLWQFQALLFLINGAFATFLLTGYKTRLSAFMCWLLMLSLHNRNPLILQGGDDLFRMIVFWGIFLPWGRKYSVDSLGKPEPAQMQVFSFATIGYLLQLLAVYFFAALLKTSPEWRTEGTALYYALSLDQMVFPIGKLIYPYPGLLKFLTISVWWLELIAPILFLIPFRNSAFKKAGILLIASLHFGISLTLFVGLFFLIGIATLLGAIPKGWMDIFDKKTQKLKEMAAMAYFVFLNVKRRIFSIDFGIQSTVKANGVLKQSSNVLLGVIIMYTFIYNWYTIEVPHLTKERIQKAEWLGQSFKFDQKWGMFSPGVFKDDGWYIYEGETLEGTLIDINRNGIEVDFSKPKAAVSLFKNDRWRKYGENYIFVNNMYMRPQLAEFLLKEWNKKHPEKQIKSLRVIYMMETTLPDYQYVEPRQEELAIFSLN